MSNKPLAAERLDCASKLASTPVGAAGLLRGARELASEGGNECSAMAYLIEAYVRRLQEVVETHVEHLRQHDFATTAKWRAAAMAVADEALDDAQGALRISS
jgi:hypothetical protein